LQSWVETADPDLYGGEGSKGLIKEHEERMMRDATEKEQSSKNSQRLVFLCAVFSLANPITHLIEYLHSIWK
jgi:hypothetical protein